MITKNQYRKKPVVIDAYELTPELLKEYEGKKVGSVKFFSDHVEVDTLEGIMRGQIGSFVITGVEGEEYVCEREIFKKTYDRVNITKEDLEEGNLWDGAMDDNGGHFEDLLEG